MDQLYKDALRVARHCYRRLSRSDKRGSSLDDFEQEAMLFVAELSKVDGKQIQLAMDLPTLHRLLRAHLRRTARRESRHAHVSLDEICEPEDREEHEPDDRAELMRDAIVRLSTDHQRIVLLRMSGESFARIASALRVRRQSVMSRLDTIVRRIKREVCT